MLLSAISQRVRHRNRSVPDIQAITPFEAFASADGHVIIALGNDTLWAKFCEHVGRQELISDKRFRTNADRTENHDQLFPILSEIMFQRTTDDWIDALGKIGVPCGPINAMDKVVTHPQVQAREMITRVAHQITGEVEVPGVPIKLSETPGRRWTHQHRVSANTLPRS